MTARLDVGEELVVLADAVHVGGDLFGRSAITVVADIDEDHLGVLDAGVAIGDRPARSGFRSSQPAPLAKVGEQLEPHALEQHLVPALHLGEYGTARPVEKVDDTMSGLIAARAGVR